MCSAALGAQKCLLISRGWKLIETLSAKQLEDRSASGVVEARENARNTTAPVIIRGWKSGAGRRLQCEDNSACSVVKHIYLCRVTAEGEGVEP